MSERDEPFIPQQSQIRSLFENLEGIIRRLDELQQFVDDNDAELREIMASISNSAQAIKTIIYGSEEFRLKGLLDRLDALETQVREMAEARKAERVSDRLKEVEAQVREMVEARKIERVSDRLKDVETTVNKLDHNWQTGMATLRGFKIAAGLAGVGSLASLATILAEIFKP